MSSQNSTIFSNEVNELSQIPEELKDRPQWVAWRLEDRNGKPAKTPVNPKTRGNARVNDPATWGEFSHALGHYEAHRGKGVAGIGFVFSADDPFTGIDLDKCRDPKTGDQRYCAQMLLGYVGSYSEVSPSENGVHIIVRGRWPVGGHRKAMPCGMVVEGYDRLRYFTLTGQHLEGTPETIEECQDALNALCAELFPQLSIAQVGTVGGQPPPVADNEIIQNARTAANSGKFSLLFDRGDWQAEGYPSQSEADLALCRMLAYWTTDPGQIDRLFCLSALMRPKWDDARGTSTYGQETIEKALKPIPSPRVGSPTLVSNAADLENEHLPDPKWPPPMRPEAYYGLAGEFVSLTLPHTEGDPVALVTQFLTMFGNASGRNKFFQVEATEHYPRLNSCVTGPTGTGRKGTTLDHVEKRFKIADAQWFSDRTTSGLGSGEGLIWQVRDPNPLTNDRGVLDKRLLVVEPEFASILKVMGRQDSILSDCIRNAWDDKPLRNTNKNSPAKATNAHISIIGHITDDELRRRLNESDMANGFANRFIFFCVRRSKLLPEGGEITKVDFTDFDKRLREALDFARRPGEIVRDEAARRMWISKYSTLSGGKPGFSGALTARASAQVVRLSLIYALLDKSPVIRFEHLQAALAVWEYAEASVRCIFGEATGNADADKILVALRNAPQGLTRSEINKVFQGNFPATRIDKAIDFLKSYGLIQEEKSTTKGRPKTIYRPV